MAKGIAPEYLYEFLAYRLPGSADSHVLFTLFLWKQLWPFTSCQMSWSDAILRPEATSAELSARSVRKALAAWPLEASCAQDSSRDPLRAASI